MNSATSQIISRRSAGFQAALAALGATCTTLLVGCCAVIPPARDYGFLEHSTLLAPMTERVPFDGVYIGDPTRLEDLRTKYRRLFIEPVSSELAEEHLLSEDFPPSFMAKRRSEYRELASYFNEELRRSFDEFTPSETSDTSEGAGDPTVVRRFEIVSEPIEDTLVLQIALVEVSPNIPGVSVLATFANFLRPGAAIFRSLGGGSVGIEGVLRDGNTGEPLLEFRDHRSDKVALLSLRNYRMYSHIKVTLTEWADELAEFLGTPPNHEVEGSIPFTLMPY